MTGRPAWQATAPWRAGAVLVAVLLAGCGGAPNAGFGPATVEVSVDVQADGTLIVEDTTAGSLGPGATAFDRIVESPRADQVVWDAATLDGASVEPGAGLTVDDGDGLHVRWTGLTADGGTHVFGLRYRVLGATETIEHRGRVIWAFGAGGRGYPITHARLRLSIPETSSLLGGTGIAEAGWTLTKTARGLEASRDAVGLDRATLLAEFAIDPTVVPQPRWQMIADLRTQFAPAFVSGGIFVLVIGAGVLWIIWLQRTTRRRRLPADADATAAALPAAVAGRLARGRRGVDDALLAAVIDRLDHGDAEPDGTWAHRQVVAEWLGTRPIETLGHGDLASMRPAFLAALDADLVSNGLVDGDRPVIASGLRTTALVGGVFAVVCAALAWLVSGRYGWWPQAIPASMLIVAVVFAVAAPLLHMTSQAGDRATRYWRQRFREPASPDTTTAALAVAAGRGAQWARQHPERLGATARRLLGAGGPAQ